MDQLKPAIAFVKKHYFWLLCGLMVVLALGIWTKATANLAERFTSRRDTVVGALSQMEAIASDRQQPNQWFIGQIVQKKTALTKEVYKAWDFLYNLQKKANPWPEDVGPEFSREINSLGPDDPISDTSREMYWTFIQDHFSKMEDIIGTRREVGGVPQAAGGGPAGPAPLGAAAGREMKGIVDWDDGNRKAIQNAYNWTRRPFSVEVRIAQEDLWVYEALLRVIAAANQKAGATDLYNAAVKRVNSLLIGQAASQAFTQSETRLFGTAKLEAESGGEESGEESGGDSGGDSRGDSEFGGAGGEEGSDSGGASLEGEIRNRLIQQRYVDQNGQPVGAGRSQPFAEFKMMPVSMRLIMNQSKIPDLLCECVNSSMPILVRRVILMPENTKARNPNAGAALPMGGFGGQVGFGGGEDEDPGGMDMPGGIEVAGFGQSATTKLAGITRNDISVEIQGIIYLFNRPDETKLGTGAAGGTATPEGTEPEPGAKPETASEPKPEAASAVAPPVPAAAPGGAEGAPTPPAAAPPASTVPGGAPAGGAAPATPPATTPAPP